MKILTDNNHEIQQGKVFLERPIKAVEPFVQNTQPSNDHINEFEQLRENAYQNGTKQAEQEIDKAILELKQKYADEHAVIKSQIDSSLSALNLLAENLIKATDQVRNNALEHAVAISYSAITRILETASIEKTLMGELCRSIIAEYGNKPISIQLNAEDFSLINSEEYPVSLTVSPELKRGQCHVLNTHGYFETGIDTRLEAVKNTFLSTLRNAQHINA